MKTLFDLTREIAEAQGVASPKPPLFDVVFSIYQELGGSNSPKTTYDILQAMLDEGLVSGGGGGGITPSGSLEILTNGNYNVTQYASASVNVPQGVFPEGTLNITENGEYEVRNYDSASISVPQGIFPSGNLNITENGDYNVENFVSTSVSVPQGVFPSGTLNITDNGNYEVAGYESASVSVSGGGGSVFDDLANAGYSAQDIAAVEGMSEANVDFTETLYEDTSEVTGFQNRFKNSELTYAPKLNTSNGTNFGSMFMGCKSLQFVPYLDTSKGIGFSNMFRDCNSLKFIPNLDTSNGTIFQQMFSGCSKLGVVPDLDLSGLITGYYLSGMFANCFALVSVGKFNLSSAEGTRIGNTGSGRLFYDCSALENVGGFTGLKISIDLQDCPLLTLQSVINILTEAADLTGLTGATLTLHADAKARLTQAEYDLAASKNWTIA